MRDIKFRAWNNKHKVMLNEIDIFDILSKDPASLSSKNFYNDNILNQYTGLEDKNGKEIYEGDILGCPWNFNTEYFSYGEVVFWKGSFHLSKGDESEYPEYCPHDLYGFNDTPTRREFWENATIIGNIHENPDLLKTKLQ
jgi:uncharacterized phage protein (TIGR01671 family)